MSALAFANVAETANESSVLDGSNKPKVSWNPLIFLIHHTGPHLQLELAYSAFGQLLNSSSLKCTRCKPHFQGGILRFSTLNSLI